MVKDCMTTKSHSHQHHHIYIYISPHHYRYIIISPLFHITSPKFDDFTARQTGPRPSSSTKTAISASCDSDLMQS